MKKVAFYTLGCRVNQYETQVMMNSFKKEGYTISEFDDVCDVYVVNSCTVTAMSDKKSRQALRKAKRTNPSSVCVIVGCYPQNLKDNNLISEADIVLGNDRKDKLIEIVKKHLETRDKVIEVFPSKTFRKYADENVLPLFDNKTRAMIKIQDGCDRFCSYCIIPYVRGPVRSRSIESIIEEAKELSEKGFLEVVLTGIQTAAYGQDLKEGSLIEVIEKVAGIDGIKRIRLGSLEPLIITDEFVERAERTKKICPSFHLSLQSGCDSVLKRMNRRYNTEMYRKSIETIRKVFPDAAITTDVIAGFPGETEEEFKESLEFIETIGFTHIHAFPYSVREGTKAAEMQDQVEKSQKEERVKMLNEVGEKSHKSFLNSLYGNMYPVLFEKEIGDNVYHGLTPNYIDIFLKSDENIADKIIDVVIDEKNTKNM